MKYFFILILVFALKLHSLENKVTVSNSFPGDETPVYFLERIFSEVLIANYDTGGAHLPSSPALSVEGNSQYHTQFFYDNFKINSFIRPGQPLLWLPLVSLESIEVNGAGVSSLQGRGVKFESKKSYDRSVFFIAGFASVGGPFLTPAGTFDKEPATAWGAPSYGNGLIPAGSMQMFYPAENYTLAAQVKSGNKKYKSLESEMYVSGSSLVTAQLSPRETVFAAISYNQRDNLGAESGNTINQSGIYTSFINGYSKTTQDEHVTLQIQAEASQKNSNNNEVYTEFLDLLDLKEPAQNGSEYSIGFDLNYKRQSFSMGLWKSYWAFDLFGRSFHRKFEEQLNPVYYSSKPLYVYSKSAVNQESLQAGLRPAIGATFDKGRTSATVQGGVYSETNYTRGNALLNRIEPEALLQFAYQSNQQNTWYMDITREAVSNQRLIHDLLHPSGQTRTKNFWQDNGDSIYQTNEQGSLLANHGASSLRLEGSGPAMHELALGFKSKEGSSKWHFRFLARQTVNTWRLVLEDSSLQNYLVSQVTVNDSAINVYDQTQGYGSNKYVLKADSEPVNQFGFTLTSNKNFSRSFFLGFSFTALFSMGYNRFGPNTYFNDWGITSYNDADPNISQNIQSGRMDQDRSYFAHVYGGYKSDNFAWTNVLQYRDGQPVTRFKVIDGLSQGPAYVQAGSYANGITGIGRTALFLNWDMHFSYHLTKGYGLSLDIFNVLNSRFLTQESLREGPDYRKPLSIMGERMLKLKVTIEHY